VGFVTGPPVWAAKIKNKIVLLIIVEIILIVVEELKLIVVMYNLFSL
jgi:hypothetical protein